MRQKSLGPCGGAFHTADSPLEALLPVRLALAGGYWHKLHSDGAAGLRLALAAECFLLFWPMRRCPVDRVKMLQLTPLAPGLKAYKNPPALCRFAAFAKTGAGEEICPPPQMLKKRAIFCEKRQKVRAGLRRRVLPAKPSAKQLANTGENRGFLGFVSKKEAKSRKRGGKRLAKKRKRRSRKV